jgi:hypothetical protein
MMLSSSRRFCLRSIVFSLFFCCFGCLTGCAIFGVAASALPPPTAPPRYNGLAGQKVGVMVWTDPGIRIDWPALQIDLANAVQNKLAEKAKSKALLKTTYPILPASIARYQQDHPEVDAMSITELAPRLGGLTRLIYIEIEDFATRSDMSIDLFRGSARATVKVVEIADGKAKVAFEQNGVQATYPKRAPTEGLPNVGDARIYAGTIDAFSTSIANLFVPHEGEWGQQ